MDVVQKVEDLSKLAFDENTSNNERLQAAIAALRLVDRFLLVDKNSKKKKKIDIAADIVNKVITDPDFVAGVVMGVAIQAEKIADGVDSILVSGKRVLDHFTQSARDVDSGRGSKGGKRRYGGRSR